jgi:hypothetical protein
MRHARLLISMLLASFFLTLVAAATPTPALSACVPDIRMSTRVLARDRGNPVSILVTMQAAASVPGGDKLVRVNILDARDAVVEIGGQQVTVPMVVPLNPAVGTWTFGVRATTPGVPYLVNFTVTDLCGEVSKFIGDGAKASSTTATPTTPTTTPTTPTATPTTPPSTPTATPTTPTATPTTPPSTPTATPVTPTVTPTQQTSIGTASSPVKLATFYRPLSDGTTEETLARTAGAAILTRTDEGHRDRLLAAGFSGPITQYLLAFETSGPAGLQNGASTCGWYQPYVNNMSGISGDFCTALHADERNFLHNGRGERLYGTQSWQENGTTKRAYLYLMNPAAPGWRAYAARRVREEVQALGYSGVFLDNVDLSLYRGQRQEANSDGTVAEFATNAAFRTAVAGFLQGVRAEIGGALLWANMTSGTDAPDDWDLYAPYLDGFMSEYFVARWSGTYVSPSTWETQLRQAEMASIRGKTFLGIGQGTKYDTNRMRFALASYLLVANNGVAFRYGDASGGEATSPSYYQLWRYPEYEARLGAPMGARYQSGGAWRRDFACGSVTVNPSNQSGLIAIDSARPGCS